MKPISGKGIFKNHWVVLPSKLNFLLVIVLIIGIFFRFLNLDLKYYWGDETWTSLRISGYTNREITQEVFTDQEVRVKDLQRYQIANPEKSVIDTVKGLAEEEPQLTPLYFVGVRLWTEWFGSSVAAIRSFSAVVSLLAFPCLYWLCLELLACPLAAWVAIAILAVSPFHVLYAQEARMYSLWTVQILLSSGAMLRAMRVNTKASWGVYSATLVLGLYSHLLFILVAISQGIYVFILEGFRTSRKLAFYVISSAIAFLFFVPWALVIIHNSSGADSALSWLEGRVGVVGTAVSLVNNICNSFMDFWFAYTYFPDLDIPNLKFGAYLKPLLIILIVYSLYFLYRKTAIKAWLFVLILIFFTPLFLTLKDLATGSASLGLSRYLTPSYLGIEIAVAYLFAVRLSDRGITAWQKTGWKLIFLLLISGGILSCGISSQAATWSNKYGNDLRQLAQVINQTTAPLVISDSNPPSILSLNNYLEPKVKFQLVVAPNIPKISESSTDIFLYQPSKKLRKGLAEKRNYQAIPLKGIKGLWQLKLKEL